MGLPDEAIETTLRRIRSLAMWDNAWTWTAHRCLAEGRRLTELGREREAALARRHAAMADHAATLLVFDNPKKLRTLRSSISMLFAQTLPVLLPHVRRVEIAWRTTTLPGYLALPSLAARPAPLVVLLNGATTAKEETLLWSQEFLAHGLAVLALDQPGTGEAALGLELTADCDDFTDGVFAFADAEVDLDEGRIALVGFSLGGALALQAAAGDRRIAATVAVTPPYDASRWFDRINPLLRTQLTALAGDPARAQRLIDDFALPGIGKRLRCPLLVIGAGRDLIVPPTESLHLAMDAGDLATLLWFPHAGHGVYEAVADWTEDTARWLLAVMANSRVAQPGDNADVAVDAAEVRSQPSEAVTPPLVAAT
jgi:dipeptidyl aminopeptidase/acylaminoacyl peptidase